MNLIWRALAVTCLVEVPFVAACYRERWARIALVALVANGSTNLFMNVVLPGRIATPLLIGEAAAVLFEATLYQLASPAKRWRPLVVAFASNFLSFELGGALAQLIWR